MPDRKIYNILNKVSINESKVEKTDSKTVPFLNRKFSSVATVRQTRLNRGKLPNGGICYFCTRKVTRSRVFGTVKPIKCQCNKYTEISAFSHMLQIK